MERLFPDRYDKDHMGDICFMDYNRTNIIAVAFTDMESNIEAILRKADFCINKQ